MFNKFSDEWWEQEVSCGECQGTGKRSDMINIMDVNGIYYKRVHHSDDCIRKALNGLATHARPSYSEYLENPTKEELEWDGLMEDYPHDYEDESWGDC